MVSVTFSARVTDVKPFAPETELVSPFPIQVTINVQPVNDPPIAVNTPVEVGTRTDEDVHGDLLNRPVDRPVLCAGSSERSQDNPC